MKSLFFIISLVILLPLSCKNENSGIFAIPDGTYKGYFTRSSPTARYKSSGVTIIFKNDSYEGTGPGAPEPYPAICNGSYRLTDNKIVFLDSCNWPANFDWSYILASTFNVSLIGNRLILTRSYTGQVTDMYDLMKQ